MVGHAIHQPQSHAAVRARESGSRPKAAKQWGFYQQHLTIVGFWASARREQWMTEEAAKARRRRSLLEDNPTSG